MLFTEPAVCWCVCVVRTFQTGRQSQRCGRPSYLKSDSFMSTLQLSSRCRQNMSQLNACTTWSYYSLFVCVCVCLRMQLSGVSLPDWGFRQLEVVADKLFKAHSSSLEWTVEEHRYGTSMATKLLLLLLTFFFLHYYHSVALQCYFSEVTTHTVNLVQVRSRRNGRQSFTLQLISTLIEKFLSGQNLLNCKYEPEFKTHCPIRFIPVTLAKKQKGVK